jgi:hypothetical protein
LISRQARPLFNDRRKLPKMADPRLEGRYPMRGLYQALAVASMCIQSEAASRPLIADVVTALSYLASQIYDLTTAPTGPSTSDQIDNRGILPPLLIIIVEIMVMVTTPRMSHRGIWLLGY